MAYHINNGAGAGTCSKCGLPTVLYSIGLAVVAAVIIPQLIVLKRSRENSDLRIHHMQWAYMDSYPLFMVEWLAKQKDKVPLVLHNTPFSAWPATNWTLDSLAAGSTEIGHVLSKKGASNIFKYHAVNQPLSDSPFIASREKGYIEVIYTAKTFFETLKSSFDGFYYYASGGIELLNLPNWGDKRAHKMLTFPSHHRAYSNLGQVNFWLGASNVTAYTHYDTSHNLHHIAKGTKRFILIPPSAYVRLRLFPCLHELYRQVGMDIFSESGGNLMEFLRKVDGKVVEITDGDTLYIPPYWFHSVVTMETTVSVNIWSQSETFLVMEEIYSSPVPFESEWSQTKLMQVLNYFIQLLTQKVLLLLDSDVSDFIIGRVYSRYLLLLQQEENSELEAVIAGLRSSIDKYCLKTQLTDILDQKSADHLRNGALRLSEKFLEIVPVSVREMNLANYIEHLIWRMLGTEDLLKLPVYLHNCFSSSEIG